MADRVYGFDEQGFLRVQEASRRVLGTAAVGSQRRRQSPVLGGGGGGGAARIRFTILSTAFSEVLGAIGCDFVNARVNWISCKSTGVAIGDEVRIFDPELCHWNLPIDLLVGLCGTATSMDSAEFIASRYYMPDCLYVLDGQACIWMVDTLCCAEEQEIAS